MADIDIDPFGNHNKTDSHPDKTGESIPTTPGGEKGGGSSWEPECKQETSFREMTLRGKFSKNTLDVCIESYLKALVNPKRILLQLFRNQRWDTVLQGHEHAFNN